MKLKVTSKKLTEIVGSPKQAKLLQSAIITRNSEDLWTVVKKSNDRAVDVQSKSSDILVLDELTNQSFSARVSKKFF